MLPKADFDTLIQLMSYHNKIIIDYCAFQMFALFDPGLLTQEQKTITCVSYHSIHQIFCT